MRWSKPARFPDDIFWIDIFCKNQWIANSDDLPLLAEPGVEGERPPKQLLRARQRLALAKACIPRLSEGSPLALLDYDSLRRVARRQTARDDTADELQRCVRSARNSAGRPHVLFVVHPWPDPIALTRIWCLFELMHALLCNAQIHMSMSLEAQERHERREKVHRDD